MDDRRTAALFKALADENRIRILRMLCGGEKCACMLLEELDIRQSTLSHHMKILCDAGIVTGRREGKWMHYSISCQGAADFRARLLALTSVEAGSPGCRCRDGQGSEDRMGNEGLRP